MASGQIDKTEITVNELSQNRRHRLRRVLSDHLPPDVFRHINITGHDATRWGIYNPQRYDAILLDVPCSSERHVLKTPAALATWSPARIRQLSRRQYALASAAVDSVKPGGYVVYATCALSPEENEAVLARIIRRGTSGGRAVTAVPIAEDTFRSWDIPVVEMRSVGVHILPDRSRGAGPMYCALLQVPAE
jgi:16S rRNA C967 or C1407 C5-methylase (RsmB/RsmF family)